MFQKYGTGLGIKTVQEREAKNAQIVSFARNSQYKQHWFQVFRHYHISKSWPPIKQLSLLAYFQSHDTLIPSTRIPNIPAIVACLKKLTLNTVSSVDINSCKK